MAAQLFLSNRLKGFQDAANDFGQTWTKLKQLKLDNERQAKADAIAQQQAEQQQLEGAQRLKLGGVNLANAEREHGRALEMDSLQNQFAQADTGSPMGPLQQGDFQAGMANPTAALKDRLRARMFTQSGTPTETGEVTQKREDAAFQSGQLRTKAQQTAETHASQLATEKVKREQGNFSIAPGVIGPDGNAVVLNNRKGTLSNSGFDKVPTASARGRDGLTEDERRDKAVFAAKDKLRDVYEKTGTANAVVMLNDIASKIGGVDGTSDIPGYGAGNLKPQAALDQSGKDVRTSLAGLRNIVLKERSGAAVSNQEFERLKEEIGGGRFSTDADLRSKLKRMGEIVAQHAQSIDATFQGDPEVPRQAFDEYKKAGGVLGSSLNLSGKKKQGAVGSWDSQQSNIATVKSDADFDALPSGAVFIDPDGVKRRKP